MDKKLLDALNNLSSALEEIADALNDKSGGSKSPTADALQMGDFGGDMMMIVAGIKSIKKDTLEILKNQKTITSMSGKSGDDKSSYFEKAGGDKKSEGNIKKGVGTILLIAVAVLAIGAAFKLVGNVNFLSVISLSIAMYILADAFAKVGMVVAKMSMRDVIRTGLALVAMAAAVTISSYILKRIVPIGFIQILTGTMIIGMFAAMSRSLEPMMEAFSGSWFTRLKPRRLLLGMVAISAGIVASSHILKGIVPVNFLQMLSAILIAGMFAVVSINFDKLAQGLASTWFTRLTPGMLLRGMIAIAAGITASSWILKMITPIGLAQAVTAILIAAMFAVMSISFHKLALGIRIMQGFTAGGFSMGGVNKSAIVLVMVGLAAGITFSSWILSLITPISFVQFLTALGIAIMFAALSFVMPMLATGLMIMNRTIGAKKALLIIPLIFTALSLGIMLSSHILAMSADMDFGKILKLALFGVALGIMILATLPAVIAVGIMSATGVGVGAILLGAAMIPVIALGIAMSSHIIGAGNYDGNYPGVAWAIGVGASMLAFSAAMVTMGLIAITGVGALAIAAGLLIIPMVAQAIVDTARIVGTGKYDKYPGVGWALTVAPLMITFSLMVLAIGTFIVGTLGLGGLAIGKGLEALPWIAQSIVNTSRVIGKGKYDKFPGVGWALTVTPLMLIFAGMVVALGVISIMGLGLGALAILAGVKWIPSIAWSIVQTSKIISKGKYDKYPGAEWALSVGGLMLAFTGMIVGVGALIVGSFGLGGLMLQKGIKAVKMIARSIVSVAWIFSNSRGAFKNGPPKEWAEGVSLAMGAFSPVYKMLLLGGVVEAIFGSKVTPEQYSEAIKTIASGIVEAAKYFGSPEANVAFKGGPSKDWSEGVGKAIGAFAPVYKMLVKGGIMEVFTGKGPTVEAYVGAIKSISEGIVASAKIFADAKATFDGGYPDEKWGKGVGAALNAFGPVLQGMKESSWFESDDEQIAQMVSGIKKMSYAIVKVGYIFASAKGLDWKRYPDKKWGNAIQHSIKTFIDTASDAFNSGFSTAHTNSVVAVSRSIAAVSRVFYNNRKYFSVPTNFIDTFVKKAKRILVHYMEVAYLVAKRKSMYWKNLGKGPDHMVAVAKSLVDFSRVISRGRSFYNADINPMFMKGVHSNMKYYLKILEMLQMKGKDIVLPGMFSDPMSGMAEGMNTLADSFMRMSASLMVFSRAVASLDEKKINSFQNMSKGLISTIGKNGGMMDFVFGAVGKLFGSGPSVSKDMGALEMPKMRMGKGAGMPKAKVGKYGDINQQMDRLIDTMISIRKDTKIMEQYIMKKLADMEETGFQS